MLKNLYLEKFNKLAENLQLLVLLLIRITIAGVFVFSGWGKLMHLDKTIDYFTSLGMPFASILAPFVATSELIFGFFIFIGFATRISAIPLSIIMVIAIITAKLEEISSLSSLFGLNEFLYIILLLTLIAKGAGLLSIDSILRKKILNCKFLVLLTKIKNK